MIIKTIHLMNFANADTLAPIMEDACALRRPECGLCSFSFNISRKVKKLARKQFPPEQQRRPERALSGWQDVRPFCCDSDKSEVGGIWLSNGSIWLVVQHHATGPIPGSAYSSFPL